MAVLNTATTAKAGKVNSSTAVLLKSLIETVKIERCFTKLSQCKRTVLAEPDLLNACECNASWRSTGEMLSV